MGMFRCVPSTPLDGDLRLEEAAALMPGSHVVKGMFFKPLVKQLGGEAWRELAPLLRWPPRDGRYVAFKDYPQHDHLLVSGTVARKRYSRVSMREALRRLARDDIRTFGDSTFGGVMLSLVRDARGALHKFPAVYERVAPGDWTVSTSDTDDGAVSIDFTPFFGDWSYTLGQIEGVVMHFGSSPVTVVHELEDGRVRFDVTA